MRKTILMAKNFLLLIATLAFLATASYSCKSDDPVEEPDDSTEQDDQTKPDPKPEPQPELEPLVLSVPVTDDWVWEGRPQITIHVENPNEVAVTADAKAILSKDIKDIDNITLTRSEEIPAKGSRDIVLTSDTDLDPGFYRAACFVSGKSAHASFCFGISPTQIVSAPDMQDDFTQFWEDAKAQLKAIDMQPNLIELPAKSNAKCKVYLVEIQSVPDGLEGDPVTVRGYYLEPTDGEKHPVIMHYYGYDTRGSYVSCPSGNNGTYAELYFSHRGQYINRAPANKRGDGVEMDFTDNYGDWFAFQFGDRDGYYYRGAFLDCVQAVNFMATRETSDMGNLFAEGSSQGGALTYATAALSDYPFSAIAPCVAFLGDYPDYFKIVGWPANTAKSCAKSAGMTDDEMYTFLSYFDTKNLATRISCPVIASSCLQDGTCPPHTNLAPYNNLLSTEKQIHFYPLLQHEIPKDWPGKTSAFFKSHTR